ncbi:DNA polymerase III subunit alpha [Marixanthomonas ophiurae]|uniref:DNA-directed DNA polymerase n=1 Tax=Marixanthomonas ophiurae TaxID=387659 RepID=A0A3E1Q9I4_9FLAO|nr:DNA polymerase III subunit alpha [Marixanthomonas ophiurae]RFN58791.1 DNA polymerase III subunit alpha [Marixanthomonas ophiurae]
MYTNCHTYYSLRYGTFSEIELLELAQQNNIKQLALTDINSTSACLSMIKNAPNYNIDVSVGVDFRNGTKQEYVVIAKDNIGFQNINGFLTEHLHKKKDFPELCPKLKNCFFIYPFEKVLELEKKEFSTNEFIGISIVSLRKLLFSCYKHYDNLVIQQPVSFRNQNDYNAHRLLRAIDLNILLSKLPETEQGSKTDKMISKDELLSVFESFPKAIENTNYLLENSNVHFLFNNNRENQNQECYLANKQEDYTYLRKLVFDNIAYRYPHADNIVFQRIEKELKAIKEMDFVSYFLINWDLLQYAKSKNYPYIGRGSGANSIVAYIIGITNVDPIELDLYFERFINVYRSSPPDFDLDFSWRDRDDITHYIFNRFKNTALMGTYVTFKFRAVVRELGKVFGLPKAEIDSFLKGNNTDTKNDEYIQLIVKYGKLIHGFPNYLSVHSGGILITKKPINYYTATFMPPKGFQTVQIDMNIAEDVGIFKFDILAQRGLSKIKECLEIIAYNQPDAKVADIDMVSKFKSDPAINNMLKTGDCMGVFYVESPAMRVLMTKLETQDYLGLVAASSIIRPGVTNGGMKDEYILRHKFPEKRKNGHPVLLEILKETYGVMVYQEDVLKVAHYFAGLDLGEADILRRGMSGKSRSNKEIRAIEKKFKDNCIIKGYPEKLIEEIWGQVSAFAGYAFAKGHSASYAVESYQSLYLKKYFPLEFMVAVLNNGGGFYSIETYVQEIKMQGGIVEKPCINNSLSETIIQNKTIYLGFQLIKDLEVRTIQKVIESRSTFGIFESFDDFIDRVPISLEQLIILIRIDAFRFTRLDKHQIMWEAHLKVIKKPCDVSAPKLFHSRSVSFKLPEITTNKLIDAYDEMELIGFPLNGYFNLIEKYVVKNILAKDIPLFENKQITIFGKLITLKGTNTAKGDRMNFGTFIDFKGTIFDTVHFPNIAQKYTVRANGVYLITGKVVNDLGYYSIVVDSIKFQKFLPDPRLSNVNNSDKNMFI